MSGAESNLVGRVVSLSSNATTSAISFIIYHYPSTLFLLSMCLYSHLQVIQEACRNRRVAETSLNGDSSRSHCVFGIHIWKTCTPVAEPSASFKRPFGMFTANMCNTVVNVFHGPLSFLMHGNLIRFTATDNATCMQRNTCVASPDELLREV